MKKIRRLPRKMRVGLRRIRVLEKPPVLLRVLGHFKAVRVDPQIRVETLLQRLQMKGGIHSVVFYRGRQHGFHLGGILITEVEAVVEVEVGGLPSGQSKQPMNSGKPYVRVCFQSQPRLNGLCPTAWGWTGILFRMYDVR